MGFTFRRGTRALALSAAAGTLLLVGPALPATAQTSDEPPPLNPAERTGDGPLGPIPYPQQQGCMRGSPGGSVEEKSWAQRVLGFERAHEQGLTGSGTKVAVIDTGVNEHPLLPRVQDGSSSVPKGGALEDCDGHGTIVAGIIGAQQDSTSGNIGIAPDTEILSIRQSSSLFVDEETNQPIGNTQTMAQSINRAVTMGADVVNISQSSCQEIARASNPADSGNQQLHNAVRDAHEQGVVVVAAAGNTEDACQQNAAGSPSTAVLPAWFDDYVLTVAATNEKGAPSEFSVAGPWVDVAAPGENLTTVDPGSGGTGLATQIATGEQGEMSPIQGTSFAAPYVSGLAALIKQKAERDGAPLDAEQIMERIKKTSLPPGGINGENNVVGAGMIDPEAALGDVVPAEHGVAEAPPQPKPLRADVIPQPDYPALIVAIGGTGAGIAAIVFIAFLVNAMRNIRRRAAGGGSDS
ncbi:type VII secretion-associated serine protease mycosin [Saccharopolyspora sp. HNM0983]|uniref:Type VII secretion-associated serine protease mycosin n=1 Tax=Saccharopolyspora montiporae TaxID=2781240 RepID=A0A929BBK8_9PSEU|nr:type VII secretion-associated serine protease mycosin [Saccharopolyspora sp. HNM0983]MBE9375011.1 type VII secretion-associated serine protease mycosin [Saccharopolyspora sp. HNM0983]